LQNLKNIIKFKDDFFKLLRQVINLVGIVVQENESIDRALKRFKKKYERSGILKEYKKRTAFTKPSVEKRMERIKAKRRASKGTQMRER
jgi:small subunit ribosomal protein S21